MPLLDPGVLPRLWLGNSLRTATHFDYASNIAVHVAGAKTFTLFPPDQAANLYPGPLDFTPAGEPISMVDFDAPDLVRYPFCRSVAIRRGCPAGARRRPVHTAAMVASR